MKKILGSIIIASQLLSASPTLAKTSKSQTFTQAKKEIENSDLELLRKIKKNTKDKTIQVALNKVIADIKNGNKLNPDFKNYLKGIRRVDSNNIGEFYAYIMMYYSNEKDILLVSGTEPKKGKAHESQNKKEISKEEVQKKQERTAKKKNYVLHKSDKYKTKLIYKIYEELGSLEYNQEIIMIEKGKTKRDVIRNNIDLYKYETKTLELIYNNLIKVRKYNSTDLRAFINSLYFIPKILRGEYIQKYSKIVLNSFKNQAIVQVNKIIGIILRTYIKAGDKEGLNKYLNSLKRRLTEASTLKAIDLINKAHDSNIPISAAEVTQRNIVNSTNNSGIWINFSGTDIIDKNYAMTVVGPINTSGVYVKMDPVLVNLTKLKTRTLPINIAYINKVSQIVNGPILNNITPNKSNAIKALTEPIVRIMVTPHNYTIRKDMLLPNELVKLIPSEMPRLKKFKNGMGAGYGSSNTNLQSREEQDGSTNNISTSNSIGGYLQTENRKIGGIINTNYVNKETYNSSTTSKVTTLSESHNIGYIDRNNNSLFIRGTANKTNINNKESLSYYQFWNGVLMNKYLKLFSIGELTRNEDEADCKFENLGFDNNKSLYFSGSGNKELKDRWIQGTYENTILGIYGVGNYSCNPIGLNSDYWNIYGNQKFEGLGLGGYMISNKDNLSWILSGIKGSFGGYIWLNPALEGSNIMYPQDVVRLNEYKSQFLRMRYPLLNIPDNGERYEISLFNLTPRLLASASFNANKNVGTSRLNYKGESSNIGGEGFYKNEEDKGISANVNVNNKYIDGFISLAFLMKGGYEINTQDLNINMIKLKKKIPNNIRLIFPENAKFIRKKINIYGEEQEYQATGILVESESYKIFLVESIELKKETNNRVIGGGEITVPLKKEEDENIKISAISGKNSLGIRFMYNKKNILLAAQFDHYQRLKKDYQPDQPNENSTLYKDQYITIKNIWLSGYYIPLELFFKTGLWNSKNLDLTGAELSVLKFHNKSWVYLDLAGDRYNYNNKGIQNNIGILGAGINNDDLRAMMILELNNQHIFLPNMEERKKTAINIYTTMSKRIGMPSISLWSSLGAYLNLEQTENEIGKNEHINLAIMFYLGNGPFPTFTTLYPSQIWTR